MWPFNKQDDTEVTVITQNQLEQDSYLGVFLNAVKTLRRTMGFNYGQSPNGKRDFNTLFGYGVDLSYSDYYGMYKRGGIAGTVVSKVAKACWRDNPTLKAGDTEVLADEVTVLRNIGFFKAMERADILNRIGKFSVLVLGIPDGEDFDQDLGTAKPGDFQSMYFNPYNYDGIEIVEWDNDPASPRFGLPIMYQVQLNRSDLHKDVNTKAYRVHWSRIIHMAEGGLESTIEGTSALEQPWNALMDKDKVRGSSAEAYYRNSRQKLALEADKDAQIASDETSLKNLKDNVENFQNGLEDVLRLDKMKANMLQPGMASPRDPFDICVEEISGTTGIPIRILTTKAGGVVAGTEDKATWNALILDRQEQECTIWLVRALEIMSNAGLLDLPEGIKVEWEPSSALTEKDAADVMDTKADALNKTISALSQLRGGDLDAKTVLTEIGFDSIDLDMDDLDDKDLDDLDNTIGDPNEQDGNQAGSSS